MLSLIMKKFTNSLKLWLRLLLRKSKSLLYWSPCLFLSRSMKCLISKTMMSMQLLKQIRKKLKQLSLKSQSLRTKLPDRHLNPHLKLNISRSVYLPMLNTKRSQSKLNTMNKFILSSTMKKPNRLKRFTTYMRLPSPKSINTKMRFYTHMLQNMRSK